jgi:hypothetical protein
VSNSVSLMKRIALAVALVSFASGVIAEPNLIGQWKSDADLTMRFNSSRSALEPNTELFLSQIMGHLTLTITADSIAFDMPDVETKTAEGKKSQLVGFRETHPYRVLVATSDSIAIKSVEPVTDKDTITVYNFVGPDTMWVYSGGADNASSSHLREFFVRIKANNAFKADVPKRTRP